MSARGSGESGQDCLSRKIAEITREKRGDPDWPEDRIIAAAASMCGVSKEQHVCLKCGGIKEHFVDKQEMPYPQDTMLMNAQIQIVEQFGQWSKQKAQYLELNPFEAEGVKCGNCIFFNQDNTCKIVMGEILPVAFCKFWIIPEQLLEGNMQVEIPEL
ncbi:MAG: hypothetical protein V3U54_13045 [Thermodesulfobacteriota bacterium]